MISTTVMHRVSPWLMGLFLLAQIFGVVPLISCHSAHAAGGASILCEYEAGAGALPQSHHHHPGDPDDAAHHHALQDLNGVIAGSPERRDLSAIHGVITARAARALAAADEARLERPPNSVLSV